MGIGFGWGRLWAIVVTMVIVWCGATTAGAAPPGMPPRGKVLLGTEGLSPEEMQSQTGARHPISMTSLGWGQGVSWGAPISQWLAEAQQSNARKMFHLTTTKREQELITPLQISRGAGDDYLIEVSRIVNESQQIVYIRPMGEMNGHWNVWCAYNADGSRRGRAHSTRAFRRSFQRIALIMRGGSVATINSRLRRLGMPPLNTSETSLPRSGYVALVWNPQGEGAPNVHGNRPRAYFPGRKYVDYVANDLYAIRGRAHWKAQNALYASFPRIPFMVAEWAPWGRDDPAYIRQMFRWVRTHRRTVALMYYSGNSSTIFRLSNKPRSRKTYRRMARAARFRCSQCGTFAPGVDPPSDIQ